MWAVVTDLNPEEPGCRALGPHHYSISIPWTSAEWPQQVGKGWGERAGELREILLRPPGFMERLHLLSNDQEQVAEQRQSS